MLGTNIHVLQGCWQNAGYKPTSSHFDIFTVAATAPVPKKTHFIPSTTPYGNHAYFSSKAELTGAFHVVSINFCRLLQTTGLDEPLSARSCYELPHS
jgi:hypothetical protein